MFKNLTSSKYRSVWELNWGDGTYLSSEEEWDDGNRDDGDGWSSTCTIELGYECNTAVNPNKCNHFWGNKVINTTPFNESCDDGDNMSSDGCDSNWNVEFNYVCTGAGPESCTTIYDRPSVYEAILNDNANQITVIWNTSMFNFDLDDSSLQIKVLSNQNEDVYETKWTDYDPKNWEFSSGDDDWKSELIIEFQTTPRIIGNGETVVIYFQDVNAYKSIYNIPIESLSSENFAVDSLPASDEAKAVNSGLSYTFIFTVLLSLSISNLTGGSSELMWSLANTLQLLFYLRLLNLYFNADLKALFGFMTYSNMNNPVTNFLSNLVSSSVTFTDSPLDQNFQDVGFEYANFLQNSLDKIVMLILLTIFMILIFWLSIWLENSDTWWSRRILKTDKSMRYESYTRFWVEIMLNLTVGLLINLWHGSSGSVIYLIANFVASLVLIFILLLIIYWTLYPVKYQARINSYPDLNQRHSLLFFEFK